MAKREMGEFFGAPSADATPKEVLLQLVRSLAGNVAWLQWKVSNLLEYSQVEVNDKGDVSASVWVRLLGEYVDRLARVSKLAADAGVEERYLRIAEEQGQWLATMLDHVLGQLELTPAQRGRVPVVLEAVLVDLSDKADSVVAGLPAGG